jgi:anti-sigma regulatory factor (Ser/Thr protein kinase)
MTQVQHLTIHFANNAEEAPRVAKKLSHFLTEQKVPETIINRLLLCVDELVTNIIAHAYKDKEEHAVLLECRLFDNRIELELRDDGTPFDPTQKQTPNVDIPIEDRNIGGLGIHLVTTLMDKVEYHREGDFNVLVSTKMLDNI